MVSNGRVKNKTPNPDHNIWNNNGTWWCHFTVHNPDYTKERVRVSLHTKDRNEARQRRDFIMRGTSAIITTLPRTRGQGMPDIAPEMGVNRVSTSDLRSLVATT
jgi:hypothetical protein